MSTDKPRFMVTVTEEMRQQIDEYRFANHCRSQTQAINELLYLGIQQLAPELLEQQKKEEPVTMDGLTEEEREFMSLWDQLTPANQRLFLGIGALILQEQQRSPD